MIKINKTIYLLLLTIFLINCLGIKSIYGESLEIDKNTAFDIRKLKLNNNQSIVYFTETFDNNLLQIEVDKKIVFNQRLKTIEQLGYADSCIIENNKNVLIIIDNKKQIKLHSEKLPKYKFIYIKKDRNHYKVEYTNKIKSFL